ncbi:MAG: GNAT family N-acetyltransferase [SAR324 cluster bacterium]|nr:GNAT family N-acetyltransferase [SAR324 cluster bacterium]
MSQSQELPMLNAMELLHYGARFHGKTFFIYLESTFDFEELLTDFRVLLSAKIRLCIFFSPKVDLGGLKEVKDLGFPFTILLPNDIGGIRKALGEGETPLVQSTPLASIKEIDLLSLATKFIHIKSLGPMPVPAGGAVSFEAMKEYYLQVNAEEAFDELYPVSLDTAFVAPKSGNLFVEIFTHQGSGLLVTQNLNQEIRRATKKDVMDISLLMKPYIQKKSILPVTLEELATKVEEYFVTFINDELVGAARLKPWGTSFELSKFCTLPRYRGKGIAKSLCANLIEEAKTIGIKELFALSIEPKMIEFFEDFGFEKVEKNQLPKEWQKGYDQKRESTALSLHP